jgi:chaperonin GroEL
MNGYQPKDLYFDDEARKKLVRGIEKVEKAVGSTLGPRGNTVLMESQTHTHGMTVTKDGVTVAKSISLIDPVENLAVRVLRQASEETANQAGDGTTTSMVLAKAIIEEFIKVTSENTTLNQNFLIRELRKKTSEIVKNLEKRSIKVTRARLKSVATISCNNDPVIGAVISGAYKEVGNSGIVTVAKSDTTETHVEITRGIRLDKGMTSRVFANNEAKDHAIFEDTQKSKIYILLSTTEISNISHLEAVLSHVMKENSQLIIIANTTTSISTVIAQNVNRGTIKACIINPPNFGYKQNELMSDIAMMTGATLFSDESGEDISIASPGDLGTAKTVTADSSSAVIVSKTIDEEKINERINQLNEALKGEKMIGNKAHIKNRIASLSGGIAVVFAGGDTQMEQKELYDRIDDAIQAVRSSIEEGILPGGGAALWHESLRISGDYYDDSSLEATFACRILMMALRSPMYRISQNAGVDISKISFEDKKMRLGYDAVNMKKVDMITAGIIDPAKVTKSALINAVSAASTIMTTNAVVTLARSYEAAQ